MNRPAIVIIHYHLRPGGVTRVIERAVESLGDRVDLLCLSGEAPAPGDALTPITEPFQPLAYASAMPADFKQVAEDLRFTATRLLGREPDIWHIHNHALGKNGFTPALVKHLADAGCRMLLQPHDFAEDGRPDNYRLLRDQLGDQLETVLYPAADHIWYAPINFRDKSFLEQIGLRHVHELPNAVTAHAPAETGSADKTGSRTVVYPARAIRRKNMGEFLLWSLLAPEGYTFQRTLAPRNPVWQKTYQDWVDFAKELQLPVEFDAGRKHDFSALIRDAEVLISTSIAEGFGLAFLEPWLEGKNLIGRKLPEITPDFEDEGLDLSGLYATLPVPLAWAGESLFLDRLRSGLQNSYAAYSRTFDETVFDQAFALLVDDGRVDFGILDEELQQNVIRHLANHEADRMRLPAFDTSMEASLLQNNRQVVEDQYSLEAYGRRLHSLYAALAQTRPSPVSAAPASRLLDAFLQPGRFNLMRT